MNRAVENQLVRLATSERLGSRSRITRDQHHSLLKRVYLCISDGADSNCPARSFVNVRASRPSYGKFIAEPFERGFGVTVGNSLRRILLSSLEGSAVTQIKIRGAQHEFTSIPGVLEDVTNVVLNVKSLVVKNHTEGTKVIAVEKDTAGAITGADVQTDAGVEIINKDHVICTLTDDVPFMMEMVVENGRGYVPSSEHSSAEHEIGIIPIDAVYSPVTRVRYDVEATRVGQKTNYDKLTLEIWTDGSVKPELALGGSVQDSPQAPQPVRSIQRVGRPGSLPRSRAFQWRRRCSGSEAESKHCRIEAFGASHQLPRIGEH